MAKSKPQITVVNVETGEEIVRDLTADEIAQMEIDAANAAAKKAQDDARIEAKQVILDRLGITAEEARLLLS